MNKYVLLALLPLELLGCVLFKTSNSSIKKKEYINAFFKFDQIDHYHSEIDYDTILKYEWLDSLTARDSLLIHVFREQQPKYISDTTFISLLESINFTRTPLKKSYFAQMSAIFSYQDINTDVFYENNRNYFFRDILIFRLKNRVSGIVKISFYSDRIYIVEPKFDLIHFGDRGEYVKLKTILFPKK